MLGVIRQYQRAVPKLSKLSWREWRDLLSAQVALLVAQVRVRTKAQGELVEPEADRARDERAAPTAAQQDEAKRVALAVSRAAAFGVFRPACLVRSIALCRLLERRGIPGGRVEVGVIMRDGRFVAHAWVTLAGQVLSDDPGSVQRYAPLPGVNVLHGD
jgi:hypothetical protein